VLERQLSIGHQMVEELRELGTSRDVVVDTDVETGRDPESVILDTAQRKNVDLIILGTDVRSGSDRLFLGPRVDYVLKNASCPVIIINS